MFEDPVRQLIKVMSDYVFLHGRDSEVGMADVIHLYGSELEEVLKEAIREEIQKKPEIIFCNLTEAGFELAW